MQDEAGELAHAVVGVLGSRALQHMLGGRSGGQAQVQSTLRNRPDQAGRQACRQQLTPSPMS